MRKLSQNEMIALGVVLTIVATIAFFFIVGDGFILITSAIVIAVCAALVYFWRFSVVVLILALIVGLLTWGNPTMRATIDYDTQAAYHRIGHLKSLFENELDLLHRGQGSEDAVRSTWENYADGYIKTTLAQGEVLLARAEDFERRIAEESEPYQLKRQGELTALLKDARKDFDALESKLVWLANKRNVLAREVKGLLLRPELNKEPNTLLREVMAVRASKV